MHMNIRLKHLTLPSILSMTMVNLGLGCATTPPSSELTEARQIRDRVINQSRAQELAPDKVLEAQRSLSKAESAHAEAPQSRDEKHFAYMAQRRFELAQAEAFQIGLDRETEKLESQFIKEQAQTQRHLEEKLSQVKAAHQNTKEQLQEARSAQVDAELRAQDALKSLKEVAKVKMETQRTVISLTGGVFFRTGKSDLLPIAENRLTQVARALKDQANNAHFVVEGYTDSRGSSSLNEKLSRERAESVYDFLIRQGLDANRLRFEGKGESNPIASNDTPEGRANNRRVEIVISKNEAGTHL